MMLDLYCYSSNSYFQSINFSIAPKYSFDQEQSSLIQ